MDTQSRYIEKILTVRDLDYAFASHPKYVLMPMDKVAEGFKQTERLCRTNENAPESRQALAEAALAADIWGEARRNLLASVNDRTATQGTYKMLARVERRERHNESAATTWLTKASEAAPDPAWLCRNCGAAHENWAPICTSCNSFNSMDWQSPGKGRGALSLKKDIPNDD